MCIYLSAKLQPWAFYQSEFRNRRIAFGLQSFHYIWIIIQSFVAIDFLLYISILQIFIREKIYETQIHNN